MAIIETLQAMARQQQQEDNSALACLAVCILQVILKFSVRTFIGFEG